MSLQDVAKSRDVTTSRHTPATINSLVDLFFVYLSDVKFIEIKSNGKLAILPLRYSGLILIAAFDYRT